GEAHRRLRSAGEKGDRPLFPFGGTEGGRRSVLRKTGSVPCWISRLARGAQRGAPLSRADEAPGRAVEGRAPGAADHLDRLGAVGRGFEPTRAAGRPFRVHPSRRAAAVATLARRALRGGGK